MREGMTAGAVSELWLEPSEGSQIEMQILVSLSAQAGKEGGCWCHLGVAGQPDQVWGGLPRRFSGRKDGNNQRPWLSRHP